MRKLLISLICIAAAPLSVFAYTSPGSPQGFVNDFAKILNASDIQSIESRLKTLEQETGTEVAVVTITTLGDETIETYAEKLFQEWGIGKAKQDNGLLLLVAPNDREVRIEVGYGLEGAVTDLQSGNIIRKVMIPAFQKNDYAGGIVAAVDALNNVIRKSPEGAQYSEPESQSGNFDFAPFLFVFIFILNAIANILGKTKSWWLGGVVGAAVGAIIGLIWGFMFAGISAIAILTILGLILDYFVSKRPPGSSGHGGWPMIFGGGRHGNGGGFGGFGGGSSGGGGASGRW